VHSVASFFISRIDTAVDAQLATLASQSQTDLRGKAAIAQAQLAYRHFLATFRGPRWAALAQAGAQVQRPLWASTSTKDPRFPDTLYVDALIGPDTVNTMPEATIAAFNDHGTLRRTIDEHGDTAVTTLKRLAAAGIDLTAVTEQLEEQAVAAFIASFDDALRLLDAKAHAAHSPPQP
jgi:transaldolase